MSTVLCNVTDFCLSTPTAPGGDDRTAIIGPFGSVNFRQLRGRVAQAAKGLELVEVKPGDRVVIAMDDGPEFAATLFAVMALGAVAVMVDPASKDLAEVMKRVGATIAVGQMHTETTFSFSSLVYEVGDDQEFRTHPTVATDDAVWLFTGGTTGKQKKIVRQSHGAMIAVCEYLARDFMGYTPDDRTLSVPRLYFGYATGANLLFPLSLGGTAVLMGDKPTPERIFAQVWRYRPTIFANTPSFIAKMLDWVELYPGIKAELGSLRMMISAGQKLPEVLAERWARMFPNVPLCDGLGFAEHWHLGTFNRPDDITTGSVGRIVPGVGMAVRNDEGVELPIGEVGNLWVTGPGMSNGYYNDGEANAAAFRDGWFVTGDLARFVMHTDGFPRLVYAGRTGDTFKVNGQWVLPSEVEECLLRHPSVAECKVLGHELRSGLMKPYAFVRYLPGKRVTPLALREHVLAALPPHYCPDSFHVFPDPMPLTSFGKTDVNALRNRLGGP